MVQGWVLFGAEFHFFSFDYNSKITIQVFINIKMISEVLKHMFYNINMANRSPFRCSKILFGPFGGLSPFLSLVGPSENHHFEHLRW